VPDTDGGAVFVGGNGPDHWPTMTFPVASTATQSNRDAHDTPERDCWKPKLVSMLVVVHAPVPPVGLVEASAFPAGSTATHNDTAAHDTDRPGYPTPPMMLLVFQADVPPVGLVDVVAFPLLSTTTHSDTDGQDTPER
jgi:hypothetical protein